MEQNTAVEQRSSIWYDQRIGKFTASEMHRLMTEPKSGKGLSQGAISYVLEKVSESLTGMSKYLDNEALAWGIENEDVAKRNYILAVKKEVLGVGFVEYGEHAGGSPDGLIEGGGILEIKCPFETHNHIKNCLISSQEEFKSQRPEYYWQIQANMLFAKLEWAHFVSFDYRIQEDFGLYIFELKANKEDHERIVDKITLAVQKKEEIINSLNKYKLK